MTIRPSSWVQGWLALSWVVACSGLVQADYRLIDRGLLPPANVFHISGINVAGQAVGTMNVGGTDRAYVTNGGGGGSFVATPSNAGSSQGLAINAAGDVVGSFSDLKQGGVSHAFRVTDQRFQDLGTLPNGSATATAINDSGNVAGFGYLPGGIQRAFRAMQGGPITVIDAMPGSRGNTATGINGLGTVVGNAMIGSTMQRAFVAEVGGPTRDLLDLHPGSVFTGSTFASAINDKGTVIGYGEFGRGSHAFLAEANGPLIDLGVASSALSSVALGLNNNNQVVGSLDYGSGLSHAFYWDALKRMIDLNNVLSSADSNQWVLTQAFSISDGGDISGMGYKDGQLHAFTLEFLPVTPATVPEPPAWAMMGLGAVGLVGWASLRRGRKPDRADV